MMAFRQAFAQSLARAESAQTPPPARRRVESCGPDVHPGLLAAEQ